MAFLTSEREREYAREYYRRNREAIRARDTSPKGRAKSREKAARWRANNPERAKEIERRNDAKRDHSARAKAWRTKYPEKRLQYNEANLHRAAARERKRQAAQLKATPSWANDDKIVAIYAEARRLRMDVDHIVPLQSAFVCGFHVEANLQLLPEAENCRKLNRWWPDMFEETSDL